MEIDSGSARVNRFRCKSANGSMRVISDNIQRRIDIAQYPTRYTVINLLSLVASWKGRKPMYVELPRTTKLVSSRLTTLRLSTSISAFLDLKRTFINNLTLTTVQTIEQRKMEKVCEREKERERELLFLFQPT